MFNIFRVGNLLKIMMCFLSTLNAQRAATLKKVSCRSQLVTQIIGAFLLFCILVVTKNGTLMQDKHPYFLLSMRAY